MISICKDEIDIVKIFDQIKDNSSGASVIFTGQVRDHNSSEQVYGIFYEAYEEMVEKVLKKIEKEIFKRWNITRFAAILRIGDLYVGELSVVVAVSSEHRKDAFEA
jgi:molybdopterin synthase catalytic subunit